MIVLDSAGYGIVYIDKAVSIIAPLGVYAGVSVFPGTRAGVTVAAPAGDKVVLRGLTLIGLGGGSGIYVTSGGQTYIEDCTVTGMALPALEIVGGTSTHIARTVVRGNSFFGIEVEALNPVLLTVTVTDSTITGNGFAGFGAFAIGGGSSVAATVTRVNSSGNGSNGFVAAGGMGTEGTTMVVADCIATENAWSGVEAAGSPLNVIVMVSGSSLVRNTLADIAQYDNAVVRTPGNNAVTGRGAADVLGTLTPNPLK